MVTGAEFEPTDIGLSHSKSRLVAQLLSLTWVCCGDNMAGNVSSCKSDSDFKPIS